MGFGPKAPDVNAGVQAVKNLIELLYPDRASRSVLELLGSSARALLTAKAPLTFENIARFWQDPDWRQWIMDRWPESLTGPWNDITGAVEPEELDPDFGWLLADRIAAGKNFDPSTDPPHDDTE